ncbi:hypothetical protein MTO96_007736 [Rhipicephalus appendiculatus]
MGGRKQPASTSLFISFLIAITACTGQKLQAVESNGVFFSGLPRPPSETNAITAKGGGDLFGNTLGRGLQEKFTTPNPLKTGSTPFDFRFNSAKPDNRFVMLPASGPRTPSNFVTRPTFFTGGAPTTPAPRVFVPTKTYYSEADDSKDNDAEAYNTKAHYTEANDTEIDDAETNDTETHDVEVNNAKADDAETHNAEVHNAKADDAETHSAVPDDVEAHNTEAYDTETCDAEAHTPAKTFTASEAYDSAGASTHTEARFPTWHCTKRSFHRKTTDTVFPHRPIFTRTTSAKSSRNNQATYSIFSHKHNSTIAGSFNAINTARPFVPVPTTTRRRIFVPASALSSGTLPTTTTLRPPTRLATFRPVTRPTSPAPTGTGFSFCDQRQCVKMCRERFGERLNSSSCLANACKCEVTQTCSPSLCLEMCRKNNPGQEVLSAGCQGDNCRCAFNQPCEPSECRRRCLLAHGDKLISADCAVRNACQCVHS